jgi:hypothetical protein
MASLFKPWAQRGEKSTSLESADDEQLILHVPFTHHIKLKAIGLVGGEGGQAPRTRKVFVNREGGNMSFDDCEDGAPTQAWDLTEANTSGDIEYPTRMAKFASVTCVTIYLPDNFGAETSLLYYLGFKGEVGMPVARDGGAVTAVYETRPQLSDHKSRADQLAPSAGF